MITKKQNTVTVKKTGIADRLKEKIVLSVT